MHACSNQKSIDMPIDANKLASNYALNTEKSDKQYKGKYLTIYGAVWQSYSNKYNENIIILMQNDNKFGIKCILSPSARPFQKPLKQGEIIKINGKCIGLEDFVILTGCIILKN